MLFIPVLLMLLFRKKYPRYDWNLQLTRFTNRIAVYFALMDDHYPSTDEQQAVHLAFPYPDAEHDLSQACRLSSGCSRSPLPQPKIGTGMLVRMYAGVPGEVRRVDRLGWHARAGACAGLCASTF